MNLEVGLVIRFYLFFLKLKHFMLRICLEKTSAEGSVKSKFRDINFPFKCTLAPVREKLERNLIINSALLRVRFIFMHLK